jgi:hypothetical protein
MTPRKKQVVPVTVLAHKKATVSVARNGVLVEIGDISAEDVGLALKEVLDVYRTLARMGYDEVVVDAGSHHAGPLGEFPEDEEEPPNELTRRIGFTQ